MASAIEIRTLDSSTATLLRLGMFSLSAGCAALLLMYGTPWTAIGVAFLGAVAWLPSVTKAGVCLRIHGDGQCQVIGPNESVAAQLDLAFSGWGFVLLRLKSEGQRHVLLVPAGALADADGGRFCRWLKLAPMA